MGVISQTKQAVGRLCRALDNSINKTIIIDNIDTYKHYTVKDIINNITSEGTSYKICEITTVNRDMFKKPKSINRLIDFILKNNEI
jgi:hypothetical protein